MLQKTQELLLHARANVLRAAGDMVTNPESEAWLGVQDWLHEEALLREEIDRFNLGGTHGITNDSKYRKGLPIATGVIDYFPDALAEVAKVSVSGNKQHNAGEPLHWDRTKSTDHADSLVRHLLERGTVDTDGMLHSAKVAWRALALLQEEIDGIRGGSEK